MPPATAYEGEFADWFADHATTSVHNAYYDRPAVLDLVGDCRGQRVLDVGCGAGHYVEELLARGATVHGIEGSARLLAHARARVAGTSGGRVLLRQHDLERALDFAADHSYDGVLLALVLHHIDAREQLLAELARVLRPGGWLVVSTTHPTEDWRVFGGSYFTVEKVEMPPVGPGGWRPAMWRIPLETLMTELFRPGFVLERLVEPRPVAAAARTDPSRYAKLNRRPGFLAMRLRRP